MAEELRHAVQEGKIKLLEDLEINLVVLNDGTRVIPKEDVLKVLEFLGLKEGDVEEILNRNKEVWK